MFCPACSAKNGIEQKFCRACGMNLESSVASLRQQFPGGAHSDLQRQERNLERFGTIAFAGLGIVVATGIGAMLYAIIVNMILNGSRPAFGIVLIAFLITAAMALTYVVWREHLNEKRAKLAAAPAKGANVENPTLDAPTTAKLLNETPLDSAQTVASVVEDTTQKLRIEK